MSDLNFTLLATSPFPQLRSLSRILYRDGRFWLYYAYKPTTSSYDYGVLSSADAVSWTNHGNLSTYPSNTADAPNRPFDLPPYVVVIGNQNGLGGCSVYRSTNGYSGFTIVPSNLDVPGQPFIRKFGATVVHGGYAFFGAGTFSVAGTGPYKDVWRSNDLTTWTQVTDVPVGGRTGQFFSFSDGLIYHNSGAIYKSTDLGATWIQQAATTPSPNRIGFACAYNDVLVAEESSYFDSGIGQIVGTGRLFIWTPASGAWTELSKNYGDGIYHFGAYFESLVATGGKLYRFEYSGGASQVLPTVLYPGSQTALNKIWVSDFPTLGQTVTTPGTQNLSVPIPTAVGAGIMSPPYSRLMPGSTGSISHARIIKEARSAERAQVFHDLMKGT